MKKILSTLVITILLLSGCASLTFKDKQTMMYADHNNLKSELSTDGYFKCSISSEFQPRLSEFQDILKNKFNGFLKKTCAQRYNNSQECVSAVENPKYQFSNSTKKGILTSLMGTTAGDDFIKIGVLQLEKKTNGEQVIFYSSNDRLFSAMIEHSLDEVIDNQENSLKCISRMNKFANIPTSKYLNK